MKVRQPDGVYMMADGSLVHVVILRNPLKIRVFHSEDHYFEIEDIKEEDLDKINDICRFIGEL